MLHRENEENRGTSRVQEQGARSRERILDAAETLMAVRGYAGTSISAICKESGLPASSVYWHFESKEGLLEAVMERGGARMLDEILEAYAAPGTPRERLQRLFDRSAAVFDAQPREFQRLELMITLERGPSARAEKLHLRLQSLIEEALFEVYRSRDEELARQIAQEGAELAHIMGTGATFEAIRHPETFDPRAMIEYLQTALFALGEQRLAESTKHGAKP